MKEKDFIRIEQVERLLAPYRALSSLKRPRLGWARAIREALGMSGPQLARRMGLKAAQSIEGMQKDEVSGTIKLQTLAKLADALECDLVYALVPRRPIPDIRRKQATAIVKKHIRRISHSMSLEDQAVSSEAEQSEFNRRVDKLLYGNPKKLWD